MVPKSSFFRKLIGADNKILAMGHLPKRSRSIDSNPTLVHFYYLVCFSDLHFLLSRIIIGLAFRNPHGGIDRLDS
jgi:hypothetical protein